MQGRPVGAQLHGLELVVGASLEQAPELHVAARRVGRDVAQAHADELLARAAVHLAGLVVHIEHDLVVGLEDQDGVVGVPEEVPVLLERAQLLARAVPLDRRLLEFTHLPPQLELRHHLPRQRLERLDLRTAETARLAVENAQRAEHEAVVGAQRRARVEPDIRLVHHQRVGRETLVAQRVLDDEPLLGAHHVVTERDVARHLAHAETDPRLEPLPTLVRQRDERDRRLADQGREPGEIVERPLRHRVEDLVTPQRLESRGFLRPQSNHSRAQPYLTRSPLAPVHTGW